MTLKKLEKLKQQYLSSSMFHYGKWWLKEIEVNKLLEAINKNFTVKSTVKDSGMKLKNKAFQVLEKGRGINAPTINNRPTKEKKTECEFQTPCGECIFIEGNCPRNNKCKSTPTQTKEKKTECKICSCVHKPFSVIYTDDVKNPICPKCNKPLLPTQPIKIERLKKIDLLNVGEQVLATDMDAREKINQIITYLNSKGR